MKKFFLVILPIIALISITSIYVYASNVDESTITLSPGLNVVSTPALLKGISFSNGGDNISFAMMKNHQWKAITINNDNVGANFHPLDGFIVRNNNTEEVTMTLTYNKEIDLDENLLLSKDLDAGWNLLGITKKDNPFNDIADATATTIIDFTNGAESNAVITGETFKNVSTFKLGKAYGVFVNQSSGTYGGINNYASLNGLTPAECIEICENDDYSCPNECRSGILTGNSFNNVSININSDTPEIVYDGILEANKLINTDSIFIYGNNMIPEGDSVVFYVYVNDKHMLDIELTSYDNDENGTSTQYYRPDGKKIKVDTGNSIPVRIEASSFGFNENIYYDYNFKILGNNTEYYEINPETISFTVVGEGENGGTNIDNEDYGRAYNRATNNGLLNNQTIDDTNLNEEINNLELISLINNYTETIINREPDETRDCSFVDTETTSILEACQLGLIQGDDDIPLNDSPSRISTLSILLSRALWNNRYDGEHLEALQIAGIINDTVNSEDVLPKGDVLLILMKSEGNNEHRRVANSYNFSMNDFNAVEDIYTGIRTSEGDRVIFVVRHSARENNCSENGGLTEYGMDLASGVGDKLIGEPFSDTSTDFYGSSYTKRTVQTSYYVGKNRGNENLNNNILLDGDEWREYAYVNHDNSDQGIVGVVYGNYFSDGNGFSCIEHLYEENKDTTNERALYAINRLCNITEGHPFSWITSHDRYTLPITERATNESLKFSTSNSERPNFMQGIAIIVHEDGSWEVYPVRSLDTGKIKTRENPSC